MKVAKRKINKVRIGSKVFWKPTLPEEFIASMLLRWGVGPLEVIHIHDEEFFSVRTPNGGMFKTSLLEYVELIKP